MGLVLGVRPHRTNFPLVFSLGPREKKNSLTADVRAPQLRLRVSSCHTAGFPIEALSKQGDMAKAPVALLHWDLRDLPKQPKQPEQTPASAQTTLSAGASFTLSGRAAASKISCRATGNSRVVETAGARKGNSKVHACFGPGALCAATVARCHVSVSRPVPNAS